MGIVDRLNPYAGYLKLAFCVGLLGLGFWAGYSLKGLASSVADLTKENTEMAAAIRAVNEATAERDRIAKELAAELAKPKAAPIIREVVDANPSNCTIPGPVGDGLRDAIGKANAAAR